MTQDAAQAIRKDAKRILDNFATTLSKVHYKEKPLKRSVGGFREEEKGAAPLTEFRTAMFANAPKKDADHIIAEKKQW